MINNIIVVVPVQSVARAEVRCRDEEADRAAAIRTHVGRVRRQPAAQIRGQKVRSRRGGAGSQAAEGGGAGHPHGADVALTLPQRTPESAASSAPASSARAELGSWQTGFISSPLTLPGASDATIARTCAARWNSCAFTVAASFVSTSHSGEAQAAATSSRPGSAPCASWWIAA